MGNFIYSNKYKLYPGMFQISNFHDFRKKSLYVRIKKKAGDLTTSGFR